MQTLKHYSTWELDPLPCEKKTIVCHWVYVIKVGPKGKGDHLSAIIVQRIHLDLWPLFWW